MAKELLVNVSRGEEVRVALVEDGRLEEVYLERDSAASNVGNIYLGKVTNVEGSIQAAFIDFGYGRNGFLHVQDLHPDYFPEGGRWERMTERVGKKIGRRDRPPIQDCLRRGDEIIVQIIKEGIGTKGPTLTSYPSIPGRFLVMMPGVAQMGVSKNIEDEEERRRLRKILDGLKPPKNVGFIIRTAGMGKTKAELERDFKYLTRLYEQIEHHKKNARPPALLYSEGDLVTRTIRDVWTSDVERVVCDDSETALRIKQFFKLLMPRTKVGVQLYQGQVPLFHAAGIETEIETMFSRHVPLPSGASLVIDSTEAIVAVDVNSGKFREHADAEETAFRTDMEAAEELCRQLRLRDLGGVVIVDFIDLRYSRHREALFNKLTDLFKRDKAKSRHLPMNEFGIVAITRQRMRPDLKKSVFMPCPWSGGTGFIKTPESMALDVMRRLRVATADERVRQVSVGLFPTVALHVLNSKRQALADLERLSGKRVIVRQDETLAADEVVVELLDDRDGLVQIESLQAPSAEVKEDAGRRKRRRRRRRDEDGQLEQAPGRETGAEDGLLPLPDLLELGELKLEEVEKLVDEVTVREGARREAAFKDPQKLILEALRSGAIFEDEEEEAGQPEQLEQAQPGSDGVVQEQERGGRRRRRRRGRGGRDEAEAAPAADRAAAAPEPIEEAEEADILMQGPEAAPPVETADAAAGAEGEGGRRRRRRRRRGRGSEQEQRETGQPKPEARPAAAEPRREKPVEQQLNGNRADRPTHMMQRDPFGGAAEQGQGRRGRRGRRGRGRGQPAGGGAGPAGPGRLVAAGLTDEQLDARVNGNRIPSTGPKGPALFREADDDEEPVPQAPAAVGDSPEERGEPEEGGRRRRRRRRRGRGKLADPATAVAAAADDAATAVMEPVIEEVPEPETEVAEESAPAVEPSVEEEAAAPEEEAKPARPARKKRAAAKSAKAPKKAAAKKATKKTAKTATRAKSTTRKSAKAGKKAS